MTGNTITGINSNGISGSNGELYKIEGNIIHDTKSYGIRVHNSVMQAIIANNEVKDIDSHGIYVTDHVKMVNIIGNNILNVNRNRLDDVQHIRVTANNERISIMGNICQQNTVSAEAIRITSTNDHVVRTGNIFSGLTVRDTSDAIVGVDLE